MKTQEQKTQEVKNYIAKTAEHLFTVNDQQIMKIIPFKHEGEDFYYMLLIANTFVNLTKHKFPSEKWMVKNDVFPVYVKTKSIPYFKKMREIVKVIESQEDKMDLDAIKAKIIPLATSLQLVTE